MLLPRATAFKLGMADIHREGRATGVSVGSTRKHGSQPRIVAAANIRPPCKSLLCRRGLSAFINVLILLSSLQYRLYSKKRISYNTMLVCRAAGGWVWGGATVQRADVHNTVLAANPQNTGQPTTCLHTLLTNSTQRVLSYRTPPQNVTYDLMLCYKRVNKSASALEKTVQLTSFYKYCSASSSTKERFSRMANTITRCPCLLYRGEGAVLTAYRCNFGTLFGLDSGARDDPLPLRAIVERFQNSKYSLTQLRVVVSK